MPTAPKQGWTDLEKIVLLMKIIDEGKKANTSIPGRTAKACLHALEKIRHDVAAFYEENGGKDTSAPATPTPKAARTAKPPKQTPSKKRKVVSQDADDGSLDENVEEDGQASV